MEVRMAAFANQVRDLQRRHLLESDQADLWLVEANNILATIPRPAIRNQQSVIFVQKH
jgi:hypothetical protein